MSTLTLRPSRSRHDEARMGTWFRFLRAHAVVMQRLEAELQRSADMSLADFDVLSQLAVAEGGSLRMSDLASRALISRSGMTRRVDGLEAAGLVARMSCPSDRRGALASLTPLGRQRLEAAMPTHLQGIEEHFLSQMSDDDLDCVRRALRKVAQEDPLEDDSGR